MNKTDWASPPGDTISDLLEEKDWGIDQLADLIQLSMEDTNELISGNIPITEEIARKLDQAFGGGSKFWLNREYQYRQQLIKLNEES
jgi:HTH-type transcriptional regulator/antitoxin HigA